MDFRSAAVLAAVGLAGAVAAPVARADEQPPAPAAPAAPAAWTDSIKIAGHIEAGTSLNPESPRSDNNVGQLFTDHDNRFLLNQAMGTIERDLDPKNPNFDVGFKFQGMYGSDSRYTHFLGELDTTIQGRNQLDIVEANVTSHLPVLTTGGIDIKAGQYPTPLGAEVIDATGNPLYSHSYIFNFALPFKHTGVVTTTHLTDVIDLWLGIDSGVNTSLGGGDNNSAVSGLGGLGLNLMDGNLTILALAHIGAENGIGPLTAGLNVNSSPRAFFDVVVTWKVNDKLTSTTELNLVHDNLFKATAGGAATYLAYVLTDQTTLVGRAEIFRDNCNDGFCFVGAFPGNLDFVRSEFAQPNGSITFGSTTYSEVTAGLNYRPAVPKAIDGFIIRPELRVDAALDGHNVYDDGTKSVQFTAAVDFILPF